MNKKKYYTYVKIKIRYYFLNNIKTIFFALIEEKGYSLFQWLKKLEYGIRAPPSTSIQK